MMGQTKISHKIHNNFKTIRRHVDDYQREKKLKISSGGSNSKLTNNESCELIDHLQEITYLYVKDICQYVGRIYHKKYSVSSMTKWLHTHNFGYKKAHGVPAKADKEKQKKFISCYNRLKKKAGKKYLFTLLIAYIHNIKRS